MEPEENILSEEAAKYLADIKSDLIKIPKEHRGEIIEFMLKEASIPLFMAFHACELTTHMSATVDFEGNKYEISFKSKEYAAQEAVGFAEWVEKLNPIKRFTVHPPAGSGASTGIYEKSYSDLYAIYKKGGEGV